MRYKYITSLILVRVIFFRVKQVFCSKVIFKKIKINPTCHREREFRYLRYGLIDTARTRRQSPRRVIISRNSIRIYAARNYRGPLERRDVKAERDHRVAPANFLILILLLQRARALPYYHTREPNACIFIYTSL